MVDTDKVQQLIEPEVKGLGYELVRVAFLGGTSDATLQVMAEKPDTRQLDLSDCERISRRLSEVFDALEAEGRDPIESSYRLEVSSPGIDRPLTRVRDYADWAGHEVNLALAEPVGDHRKLRGELRGIENDTVRIEDRKFGAVEVPLASIHSAKLVLTDKLIAATRPLDTSGVEEIIETSEEEKAD